MAVVLRQVGQARAQLDRHHGEVSEVCSIAHVIPLREELRDYVKRVAPDKERGLAAT